MKGSIADVTWRSELLVTTETAAFLRLAGN